MCGALRIVILNSIFVLACGAVQAQVIKEEDPGKFSIAEIQGQYRSYSNDRIRVYHRDTNGEPVCCPSHLLVLLENDPEHSGEWPWKCFQLSNSSLNGFAWIHMEKIKSDYDPAKGLKLEVPVELYNPDGPEDNFQEKVILRINLKDRNVVIESVSEGLRKTSESEALSKDNTGTTP